MGTFRLYTGSDGQSRAETIDIEKVAEWAKGIPTTEIKFSTWPVGRFIDWHPAPRRQFVIIRQGQLEIGFGDGSKQVYGPGDALDGPTEPTRTKTVFPSARGYWTKGKA